jgi:uncharacterized protein YggE
MNRIVTILTVLAMTGAACACARSEAHEGEASAATLRTISTSGRAIVHVAPDRARLSLGVETRDKDLEVAKAENDKRIRGLMEIASAHGIGPKDIHTSWISISPEYSSYSSSRRFDGYRVHNTVMITFVDLSAVEAVLSEALVAGVTTVSNIVFSHSEDRKHRDKAREMAVRAAREKAEAIAAAMGQRVGRPVTISETPPTWINPMAQANVFNDGASAGAPDAGETLAPGMVEIDARINVTFTLID